MSPATGAAATARSRGTAPRRRGLLIALAVLTLVLGAVPAPALATPVPVMPAQPGTGPGTGSAELSARLAVLTGEVEQLEVAAEVAVESYNEVSAELDELRSREVGAQVELDDAGRTLQSDHGAATRRVRALYRSGGTTEIAWTALSGGGFADAVTTYRTARVVLASDAAAVRRSREQVDVAVASSSQVQELRRERVDLEAEAELRRDAAEVALAEREQLLLSTDSALVDALERERVEAERAALAWAQAQAEAAAAAAQAQAADAAAELGRRSATDPTLPRTAVVGGPRGGSVPAGFAGPDLDRQALLDRAAAAAPSPQAAAAIQAGATRLGMPYVWGATGPNTFDCSGLTLWAYGQAGVRLPRTSRQQYAGLPKVSVDALLPGDLVFYANGTDPGSIHHVAMYLGEGLMLTAPRTGDVVKISPVWRNPIYGAVRPAG